MMKSLVVAVAAALVALPLHAASERPSRLGDDGATLRVTLTLAGSGGDGERRIEALLLDGERVRSTIGSRVPILGATEKACEGGTASTVRYQHVGIEATLQARIVGPNRVRVSGEFELSSIAHDEAAPPSVPGAPTFATFRHVFDVIVADGAPTTLAEIPDTGDGARTLTLTAEIQQ